MTLEDLEVEDAVCKRARLAYEEVEVNRGWRRGGRVGVVDGGYGRVFARGGGIDGEVGDVGAGVGEDVAEGGEELGGEGERCVDVSGGRGAGGGCHCDV